MLGVRLPTVLDLPRTGPIPVLNIYFILLHIYVNSLYKYFLCFLEISLPEFLDQHIYTFVFYKDFNGQSSLRPGASQGY